MYKISEEQINEILKIVGEIPTKLGMPIVNIFNSLKRVDEITTPVEETK